MYLFSLKHKTLRTLFSLALIGLCFSFSAQETVTYPYNPDGDGDGYISLNDLLDLLSSYGLSFEPQEHICGMPIQYKGVSYQTTLIGTQCWFAENLAAAEFLNSDEIPLETSNSDWLDAGTTSLPARSNPHTLSVDDLGYLYNWYAVSDNRGLCPAGWSVPSSSQFSVLKERAGGNEYSALALKDDDWGYNSCGFAAKQGFVRELFGSFLGGETGFWSRSIGWSQYTNMYNSKYMRIPPESAAQGVGIIEQHNGMGFYVRCVKD